MKAKKFRKYDEGGLTEGPNKNIDDDTRARAMEFVRRRMSGEESDSAPSAPAPRARPKAVLLSAKTTPAKSSTPVESAEADASVPSAGRYKQDTYETPLKSAARKFGSEAMDNLGKFAIGAGGAAGVGKLISMVSKADKARKAAQLVAGNAKLADRMKGIASKATQKAAEAPALKKANESLATRMEVAKSTAKGKADRAQRSQQGITAEKDEQGFYRAGGSVRGGGCEKRGKTKGRFV